MTRIIFIISLMVCPALIAAPYTPNNDEQTLEQLPQVANADNQDLRRLRADLKANPQQAEFATQLARRYIALGKTAADPRYYGYAQGVLKPWWDNPQAPTEVLLLRALILQNRHDFAGALLSLRQVLHRDPNHAEAWRTQAIIFQVRARYEDAQRSCLPLMRLDAPIIASTCLANLGSLTGQAEKSYAFLQSALTNAQQTSVEQRGWALTVLAEMAGRLGKNQEADEFFKRALQETADDVYLLSAYSDFLLDQQRPNEVMALLNAKTRVDGFLLRMALAKQQVNDPQLSASITELKARFAASRLRGENLHQGDEARFALNLLNQPERALQLALANWSEQREPKDARIVLEAAYAANQAAAAQDVINLLDSTKMESVTLSRLRQQLQTLRP